MIFRNYFLQFCLNAGSILLLGQGLEFFDFCVKPVRLEPISVEDKYLIMGRTDNPFPFRNQLFMDFFPGVWSFPKTGSHFSGTMRVKTRPGLSRHGLNCVR